MKKIMKNGKINGLLEVYGIIYLVKNKVNGKCYIGQTYKKNGFKDRYGVKCNQSLVEGFYKAHKNNNSSSDIILKDMEKYGLDAFEVNECIDYAFSKTELDIKEKTYISIYKSMISNSYNNYYVGGYNKTSGGSGVKDYEWSEESKQKLKEIKNTPEALERSREAAKKENLLPETLKKRSESLKGHNVSDNTKLLISDCIEKMWEDGKYNFEEVRKNMSDGQKRRWEDKDNKIKASEATKKNWEDDSYREKVINGLKEYWDDESNHEKQSDKSKKNWEDDSYREKVINGLKEYWDDESNHKKHSEKLKEVWENNKDGKEKISEDIKKKWEDSDFRERVTNGVKEYWDNEDNRKKHGEKIKKHWDKDKKEEWSKVQKEIQNRIDVKEKKSNTMTKKWQDQEYKSGVSSTLSKKWENEEYRTNVINGIKKAWENEDLRKQISEANKGGKNPNAKAVICITSVEKNMTRKVFQCISEAVCWLKENNIIGGGYISKCCSGSRRYSGRCPDGTQLKWRYLKDLNEEELKELLNKDLTDEEKEIVQKQISKNQCLQNLETGI